MSTPILGSPNARPLVVVLTGGVGSGKSSVAQVWAEEGVPIIDTDAIAHRLTGPGGMAIEPLRQALGSACIDSRGALDRAKVRAMVFSDPDARRRLEAVLHPLIRQEALGALDALPAKTPYAVLVIPLFFEGSSFRELAWRVVVVDCPVETQIERVSQRPGLDRATATAIVSSQVPRETRLRGADHVISNTGDLAVLKAQAGTLNEVLLAESKADRAR